MQRLPNSLPAQPQVVWEAKLAGPGLGGIAATEKYVLFGDRDLDDFHDVFRCLDARSGEPLWEVKTLAIGNLDYGNSPRTTPLVDGNRAILLGGLGDLVCVNLASGETLWQRNLRADFAVAAEMPWGYCGSPLLVDGKLIVMPGGSEASLVALNPADGSLVWKTPGAAPSYGSLIAGEFGGVPQIVGHDVDSLGGWDVKTGRRLWRLVPPAAGDFNVPTPLAIDGKLLVTTENNGTRLYQFKKDGQIDPEPVMENRRLSPDMSSPVVIGRRLFCVNRFLYCLDLAENLREISRQRDSALAAYGSIIAGDNRLLVVGKGELLLVEAGAASDSPPRIVSRSQVFSAAADPYSHPALVGNRLYLRSEASLVCIALE